MHSQTTRMASEAACISKALSVLRGKAWIMLTYFVNTLLNAWHSHSYCQKCITNLLKDLKQTRLLSFVQLLIKTCHFLGMTQFKNTCLLLPDPFVLSVFLWVLSVARSMCKDILDNVKLESVKMIFLILICGTSKLYSFIPCGNAKQEDIWIKCISSLLEHMRKRIINKF